MGNMFDNLKTDKDISEGSDSLGGFEVWDTNIYDLKVKLAYITFAASEAMALNLVLTDKNMRELKQQLYMTSGKDKGCKNWFMDRNDKKQYLPGFNIANALCLLTCGKEIIKMADCTEKKVIKLYDPDAKKEVPTEVPMIMDLIGVNIKAGVFKQIVDKRAKDPHTGKYAPTGETREENEIDKLFRVKDNKTVLEIRAQVEEAEFHDKWLAKWEGKVKNKAKGTAGGAKAGAPKRETGAQAGTPDLFQ